MILTKENIKSVDLDIKIDKYVKTGRFPEFVIIVPTNRRLRNLKKIFIDNSPNNIASGINIETLTTISDKLLKSSLSYTELSEAAASVFIKKSAENISFEYFNNYRDGFPEGTLERLMNVISKYKEAGISPVKLREEAAKLSGSEKKKAVDIAAIYESYNEMCNKAGAYELGDIYRQLNNLETTVFTENFRNEYPSAREIFVNGFDEFTHPEIEIIDKLSSIENISLYIDFDYYSYNKLIFSNLDKNYENLVAKKFKKVDDLSEYVNSGFINQIRNNLFKTDHSNIQDRTNDKLHLIKAESREEEVEKIAKQVKRLLIREDKAEPHRICICFNLIDNYSSLVRDIFERYSIPFNLTDRINLNRTYPVNSIISLLEISESNYYYKNIVRAFSSRFIDNKGIDTTNLLNQARNTKVVSGYNKWITNLEQSLKKLELEDIDVLQYEMKKEKIGRAVSDLKMIKSLLNPLEGKNSIDEFLVKLRDLIDKIQIQKYLINIDPISSEKNVKSLTTFIDTITETFELLKNLDKPDKKYGLAYFLKYIRTACGRARFNIKERSDYGVLITTLNEIRGLSFDYVFLGGMIDGDLPTRYSPEIFLSGSYALSESVHLTEERFRFYQALCTWRRELYLSYPMGDNRSEYVESSFINDLNNIYKLNEIDGDEYSEIIISKDEFLKSIDFKKEITELKNISRSDWEIDFLEVGRKIDVEERRSVDIFAESAYNTYLLSAGIGRQDVNEENIENIQRLLKEYRQKVYSVTELESYVKCPFKYFLERIVKIEVTEEPTEEFEALELGSVIHSILFQFYKTIRERNVILQNCSDKIFNDSLDIIFGIAKKVVKELNLDSGITFYELEKLFGIAGRREQSILYRFVDYERRSDEKLIPEFFEVNFGIKKGSGSDTRLSLETPFEIEGIKLRGKIDRIEINKTDLEYSVTDYKIGKTVPTKSEIDNGISMQLPVYLMAAKTLLKYYFDEDYLPVLMNIFSLRLQNKDFRKFKIYPPKKDDDPHLYYDDIISNTINIIKTQVGKIGNGEFHLSQLENRDKVVCRYCSYKSVCRVEEYLS